MIIKELTDEFVEVFGKPENRNGPMWELIIMGAPLPDGIDPDDPRVVDILRVKEVYTKWKAVLQVRDQGRIFFGLLKLAAPVGCCRAQEFIDYHCQWLGYDDYDILDVRPVDETRCPECGMDGEPGAALCRKCWRCDGHCRC